MIHAVRANGFTASASTRAESSTRARFAHRVFHRKVSPRMRSIRIPRDIQPRGRTNSVISIIWTVTRDGFIAILENRCH